MYREVDFIPDSHCKSPSPSHPVSGGDLDLSGLPSFLAGLAIFGGVVQFVPPAYFLSGSVWLLMVPGALWTLFFFWDLFWFENRGWEFEGWETNWGAWVVRAGHAATGVMVLSLMISSHGSSISTLFFIVLPSPFALLLLLSLIGGLCTLIDAILDSGPSTSGP